VPVLQEIKKGRAIQISRAGSEFAASGQDMPIIFWLMIAVQLIAIGFFY